MGTIWQPELPTVNGKNEYCLWMHIIALPVSQQRKNQIRTGVHSKSRIIRITRVKDFEKFFYYCYKYDKNVKIFCYTEIKSKVSHLIIPWIVWIRAIPSALKKYFDWGDKFEYAEINHKEFNEWWQELSDFPKHTGN